MVESNCSTMAGPETTLPGDNRDRSNVPQFTKSLAPSKYTSPATGQGLVRRRATRDIEGHFGAADDSDPPQSQIDKLHRRVR